MNKKLFCKNLYHIIILGIFLLGVFLRVKTYLYGRPLWLDECQIAMNIISKNITGFFSGLIWQQSAPPIFLIIVKLFTYQLGIKELALRIFPLICGLISIPVFYKFSRLFLFNRLSIIAANFLFAVNIQLIYYAQELKQYSSDVLFFMFLFILLNKITLNNISIKKNLASSLGISFFPLLSIPTYFIIGGLYLREFIQNKFKNIKNLLYFTFPLVIISTFYYIYTIKPQHKIQIQGHGYFWKQGFITTNLIKDFDILKRNLNFYFEPTTYTILKIVLLTLGIYIIFKKISHKQNLLLTCTIIFMFFFSFIHIYPLFERVALYSLPILIILIIKPLDYISLKNKIYSTCVLLTTFIAFFGYNPTYFHKYQDINPQEIRGYGANGKNLMEILIKNYNKNSCVIISHASYPEYFYYSRYYGFKPKCHMKQKYPKRRMNYYEYLNSMKNGEYWFYYSFDYDNRKVIPILKKWGNNQEKLYEYKLPNSYLLHIKKK